MINQRIVLAIPEKRDYGVPGTLRAYVHSTPRNIMPAKKSTKKVATKAPAVKSAPAKKAAAKKESAPKPAAKKVAVKAAPKVAVKAPAKKAVAAKAAAKPTAKPAPKKAVPSLDAIAKAAYLNYRRRTEQGLPGDNDSDWLEAEHSVMNG